MSALLHGFILFYTICIFCASCEGKMSFKDQCIYWHNYFRTLHQVNNVTWSTSLQKEAENWVKYLAENNKFHHSKKNPGNLYMSNTYPAEYCSDATWWFHWEEQFYNYSRPGYVNDATHFTKVVWRNSTEIGAAWAIRKDKRLVISIKYHPRGNYVGYFARNVFRPIATTLGPEWPHSPPSFTRCPAKFVQTMVPSPPQNVTVVSQSSRVVNISWTAGFDGNSDIQNYTVEISENNEIFENATCICQGLSSSACVVPNSFTSALLTGLHPGRTYYIRVFATNKVGQSSASSVLTTATHEEAPNAPPANVMGYNTSSTSISVQWGEVPTNNQNGIVVNYTVTYKELPKGSPLTKIVSAPTNQTTLTGLNEYTNYSITVFASTSKGDGNVSEPIAVITDEDKPGAAPGDVKGKFDSSTEISVTWGIVPEHLQHGDITHYIVTNWKTDGGGQNETERVDAPLRNVKLTGLVKYTFYSINVVAFTVKGGGPASPAIEVRTDEDKPSASPTISSVTVINSTSVFVEWEAVPLSARNGIITKYTIYFRDEDTKETGTENVSFPAINATVNGLRQKAEYSFWILASTVKGKGPPSGEEKATTKAVPSIAPPVGEAIKTTEVTIKFVNKKTLSSGKPVSYFRIYAISLKEDENPRNPADPEYENVELTYENQVKGKPYITAEFARKDDSRTTFTVGDGKYYSRNGITEAKRKRRAISPLEVKKYLNGKLRDDTEYAVFQRSFDKDGDYESEGFIRFETKAKPPTVIIVVVVFVLLILAVVVIVIIWRRRYHHNDTKSAASNLKDGSRKDIIEMSGHIYPATEASYYHSIQLNDEPADPQQVSGQLMSPTEDQVTYEEIQSHHATDYDDINPKQEDIYQEITDETHYRSLDLHRQANYEELSQLQCKEVDHYQPLDKVDKHVYGSQSPC